MCPLCTCLIHTVPIFHILDYPKFRQTINNRSRTGLGTLSLFLGADSVCPRGGWNSCYTSPIAIFPLFPKHAGKDHQHV